jgi:hypothetical protein
MAILSGQWINRKSLSVAAAMQFTCWFRQPLPFGYMPEDSSTPQPRRRRTPDRVAGVRQGIAKMLNEIIVKHNSAELQAMIAREPEVRWLFMSVTERRLFPEGYYPPTL